MVEWFLSNARQRSGCQYMFMARSALLPGNDHGPETHCRLPTAYCRLPTADCLLPTADNFHDKCS
jgi:hypothetical protein